MANIRIEDLADAINDELEAYSKEVTEKVNISAQRIGKAAVKKLKSYKSAEWPNYSKGWTLTKDKETIFDDKYTIHNKKYYSLTHLLENGHVKRNGGRTRAFVHIKPVEQEVIDEFTKEVEEAINNG